MPEVKPRLDTRGLPEGMDPRKFYEYRTLERANNATGLEAFVYRLMPLNLIKSFAFAIDPFSKFKVSTRAITPANRKRERTRQSVLDPIIFTREEYSQSFRSEHNYMGIPGWLGPRTPDPPNYNNTSETYSVQEALPDRSEDTTRRTRLIGSDQGEFKMFKHTLATPAFTIMTREVGRDRYTGGFPPPSFPIEYFDGDRRKTYRYSASGTFPKSRYLQHMQNEEQYVLALMQANAASLYKAVNPINRTYSLTRNIVELRDLPHSISQLRETLKHLSDLDRSLLLTRKIKDRIWKFTDSASDIPKEYVGYHFGWKQTYNDIMGLLQTPEKISKKFNLLLRRSGKATTYRSSRDYLSSIDDVPGFDVAYSWQLEEDIKVKSRLERKTQLRMTYNATFDFPPADLPTLKRDFFLRQLGVVPTPTDLYNLVPWTWLLDWFTGIGNYVEIIDELNSDSSLVNWGFLTGVTEGKIQTNLQSRTRDNYHGRFNDQTYNYDLFRKNNRTMELGYHFQMRKDFASLFQVKTLSDPSSLTAYQESILGALLAQRIRFSR